MKKKSSVSKALMGHEEARLWRLIEVAAKNAHSSIIEGINKVHGGMHNVFVIVRRAEMQDAIAKAVIIKKHKDSVHDEDELLGKDPLEKHGLGPT